uniref:Uncharacterized protein n=1 Tax=Electrophorus electricus TaxID=8005 RepID=A0A4W4G5K7_ELEEL
HLSFSSSLAEFYEVTLLNAQKSCEQKLEEVSHMTELLKKLRKSSFILSHVFVFSRPVACFKQAG